MGGLRGSGCGSATARRRRPCGCARLSADASRDGPPTGELAARSVLVGRSLETDAQRCRRAHGPGNEHECRLQGSGHECAPPVPASEMCTFMVEHEAQHVGGQPSAQTFRDHDLRLPTRDVVGHGRIGRDDDDLQVPGRLVLAQPRVDPSGPMASCRSTREDSGPTDDPDDRSSGRGGSDDPFWCEVVDRGHGPSNNEVQCANGGGEEEGGDDCGHAEADRHHREAHEPSWCSGQHGLGADAGHGDGEEAAGHEQDGHW